MINAVWLFAFTGPQSFICNSKIEKWGGGNGTSYRKLLKWLRSDS